MTDSLPCNIALLPSDNLADLAVETSRSLKGDKLYELSKNALVPHLSLYMTQLKVADFDKVAAILSDIAALTDVLNLQAINYGAAEGYFEVGYKRTSALDGLQMQVIAAINPIRDGMQAKDKARMESASGVAREHFERYGYPNVGELFRPHISFTRYATDYHPEMSNDYAKFSGSFTKLALCQMGDNGTCVRLIASFPLISEG